MNQEEDVYEDILPTEEAPADRSEVAPPPVTTEEPQNQEYEPVQVPDDATPTLYLGEFDWWVTDVEVEQLVSQYGRVDDIRFLEEKSNGKSKGWVMLRFQTVEGAARCKHKLSSVLINDKPLAILFTRVNYINHTIINNYKMRMKQLEDGGGDQTGGQNPQVGQQGGQGGQQGWQGGQQQGGNFGMGYQRRPYQNFRGRGGYRGRFNRGGYHNRGRFNNYNNRGFNRYGNRNFNNYNNQNFNNPQQQNFNQNQNFNNQTTSQQNVNQTQMSQGNMSQGNVSGGIGSGGGGGGDGNFQDRGRDFDNRSGYKRRRDYDTQHERDSDRRDLKRERR